MADVPINEKLYAMVVGQAKAKYRVYPSPGASHWVHRRYLELGGKFEDAATMRQRQEAIELVKERIAARSHSGHKDTDHKNKHEDKK